MFLIVRFAGRNGDAHTFSGFDAAHGTIQGHGVIGGETGAEASADPEEIFGFDEHAVFGNVAGASLEERGAPLDFERRLIAVARRSPPLVAATPCIPHGHGRETPHSYWRAEVE